METLTGTLIYWYISIGLIVGLVYGQIMKKEGVSFYANIFWGVIGAVIMGTIGQIMGIGEGVFFAFLATWPFLFLINVFHQHHEEDITGEIKHDAMVIYKKLIPKP
jgi:uncharacterized membrane protein YeaQ/YmgE (transglycosylase-associated protein family)